MFFAIEGHHITILLRDLSSTMNNVNFILIKLSNNTKFQVQIIMRLKRKRYLIKLQPLTTNHQYSLINGRCLLLHLKNLIFSFSGTVRVQERVDNRDNVAETQEIKTSALSDRNPGIWSQFNGN